MSIKTNYTREEIINICEHAIVPEKHWSDRDSQASQSKIGEVWALLKAGCKFKVLVQDSSIKGPQLCTTDNRTVWIEINSEGFMYHEMAEEEYKDKDTFYLPTWERLESAKGKDWY